jgi:phage tail sheath protein FI
MPSYQSPGVYVEELPSAIKAIAGLSTSTAAFIGVVPDKLILVAAAPKDTTPPTPANWPCSMNATPAC